MGGVRGFSPVHWGRVKDGLLASRVQDLGLGCLAGGDLEAVEENSGAAGADVSGGEGLDGSVEDVLSAFAVELAGDWNADLARAGRALGAAMEVTEGASAHGGRLAVESAGHYVPTFVDHEVLSWGYPPSPSGVFGANCLFSTGWRHGSTVNRLF